jgi:predicted DsbA family dithiol-disulfide isomerase
MTVPLTVLEFTDPACPWAWGSEPTFRRLRLSLGDQVRWRRVFGILFDSTEDPPPDPAAETAWYSAFLAQVARETGAPMPERLRRVARTSWPASLTAKAAEEQGDVLAERVLRRLRETTFVHGDPADTLAAALNSVSDIYGLDIDRLTRAVQSRRIRAAVRDDWEQCRNPCPEVLTVDGPPPHGGRAKPTGLRHRYALPTLIFQGSAGRQVVPGWRHISVYEQAARNAAPAITLRPPMLSAQQALRMFGSLTARDLELLTGTVRPPDDAIPNRTGNGTVWRLADRRNRPAPSEEDKGRSNPIGHF